jgi:hypothetical protein
MLIKSTTCGKIETVRKSASNTNPNLTKFNLSGGQMAKTSLPNSISIIKICSFLDCENPANSRGLCHKHYLRLWENNDSLISKRFIGTEKERFFHNVNKTPDCWLWIASKTKGYGVFPNKLIRSRLAHRYSFRIAFGFLDENLLVLHKCDTPACVNPAHLFLGTHQDNATDKISKGRGKTGVCLGEANNKAKLNANQIIKIRQDARSGQVIAEEYGVSRATVHRVKTKKNWRRV